MIRVGVKNKDHRNETYGGDPVTASKCKRKCFDYLWLPHLICINVTAIVALNITS